MMFLWHIYFSLIQCLYIWVVTFSCRCGYEFCYTCGSEWKNKKATCSCPLWDEEYILEDEFDDDEDEDEDENEEEEEEEEYLDSDSDEYW